MTDTYWDTGEHVQEWARMSGAERDRMVVRHLQGVVSMNLDRQRMTDAEAFMWSRSHDFLARLRTHQLTIEAEASCEHVSR